MSRGLRRTRQRAQQRGGPAEAVGPGVAQLQTTGQIEVAKRGLRKRDKDCPHPLRGWGRMSQFPGLVLSHVPLFGETIEMV